MNTIKLKLTKIYKNPKNITFEFKVDFKTAY